MTLDRAVKNSPTMIGCFCFDVAFVRIISKLVANYNKEHVIVDRCTLMSPSRHRLEVKGCKYYFEPMKFDIKDSTNIRLVSLHMKTLLSHNYDQDRTVRISWQGYPKVRHHTHEEANTLIIPLIVCIGCYLKSTDVYNYLMDLCSTSRQPRSPGRVISVTGKETAKLMYNRCC